ncbi:MAG: FMN-binding protein, partial [Gammaproteobacteria bacterium]|nr:FMN-binding protein [Gammaproteobacteria bacterium]
MITLFLFTVIHIMKTLNKLIFILLMILTFSSYANSQLEVYQKKIDLSLVYPGASYVKPMQEVSALSVFLAEEQVGYVIINTDYNETIGYSGKPMHVAIGIDNEGEIKGAQLLKHSEPIVLVGIPEKRLTDAFRRYDGFNVVTTWLKDQFDNRKIDAISGATVTDRVIDDSILRASLKFATQINIASLGDKLAHKNRGKLKAGLVLRDRSWNQLIAEGAIVNSYLSVADVSAKYVKNGDMLAAKTVESDNPKDTFIDLNLALVSIEELGKNILGKGEYRNLIKQLAKD